MPQRARAVHQAYPWGLVLLNVLGVALIAVGALRLVRPDLAMMDGTAELKYTDGTGDTGPFTVVWTRTGDKWQILSVRDLPGDAEAGMNPSAVQLRQRRGRLTPRRADSHAGRRCRGRLMGQRNERRFVTALVTCRRIHVAKG